MYWLRFVLTALALLTLPLWLGVPEAAAEEIPGPPCRSAGIAFWQAGDRPLETFDDGHGNRIELWCSNGVFNAHYDLRVSQAAPPSPQPASEETQIVPAGYTPVTFSHAMTVAGCFFNFGKNTGPDVSRSPSGSFTKVDWTTRSPDHDLEYHFRYDFSTRLVAITVTTPCTPPVTKVVAPQESYEALETQLPEPSSRSCPVPASSSPSHP